MRIAGDRVYVATMEPADPLAPACWEHATVFALEASTGRVVAVRPLPDPVPVAAMVIDGGVIHVLATRPGEPIFWYARSARATCARVIASRSTSRPRRARAAPGVLEAWASADGGIWMELREGAPVSGDAKHAGGPPAGRRTFAFAKDGNR